MKELSFLALAAGLAAGAAGSAIAQFAADPGTRCRCAPAVNREYSH